MLFSILIDADRLDAANLDIRERYHLDPRLITNYINRVEKESLQKFGDKINSILKLRSFILRSVLEKLPTVGKNRIFSLTAPTGSGKTLTAFLFAIMLRHQIYQEAKRHARIIYVLPFLSIIDQNAKVIQESLELNYGSQTGMVITHHHLSRLQYYDTDLEKESYSSAESELLIEGWHSEVIITTFVQFLETVIGTSASYLRKLHNIPGSIVILDEVQSIDYKHWLLVHDCLKFLAEEFDTRIILMTATQPLIFTKENKEILELVDSGYCRFLRERVQLKLYLKNGICLDKFIDKINKLIDEFSDESVLIIMNTIQSAVYVSEKTHGNDYEKFYLSSEVTPSERQERIKIISERLEERQRQRTILISTQVVEAGVDFDFDLVVRDLAPIDSII
jgi:CRISPR-associated endonuclease/helicase Cas3